MTETLKTSDYHLAAYSLSRGGRMASINRSNARRAVFELEVPMTEAELLNEFWKDRKIHNFIEGQIAVKKRLYSDSF